LYLKRIFIRNYRSIKELSVEFLPGKNVLVGRNNSGKSNIVKAIDLILGQNSPTYAKSENITENDFYSWKELIDGHIDIKQSDEINIWCELERNANEPLNYSEMYHCFGFYVSGSYNNRVPTRLHLDNISQQFETIFQTDEDDTNNRYYVNPKKPIQHHLEDEFQNKYHFAFAFKATLSENGEINKEIRLLYRENDNNDWVLSLRATIRNELIQSAIIPFFRDPAIQLRPQSWNWYGKLLRHLTDKHANSPQLQSAFDSVKQAGDGIFTDVTDKVKQTCINIAFSDTELSFQFVADKRSDLYKSCQVYIDDGFKSQIFEKGSGIQSAAILGLFNYYTKYINTISSALLCIEEPEIYLHPHGRRLINSRLDDFIDNNKNQVILTTHAVEFVKLGKTSLNVIQVQKDSGVTKAKPINLDSYKNVLISNGQNEVFFAEKVIICEGKDEHVLRLAAEELLPAKLDEKNVSIVAVDGKDNINLMARLVLLLGIQCFICADFDYLLRDMGEEGKKYDNVKLHKSVLSLNKAFFHQPCIFGAQGDATYQILQKARDTIKKHQEQVFYCSKNSTEITCYPVQQLLVDLRSHGVCVLDGEIESLSKDPTFLKPDEKLNGEKIYEMFSRVHSGQNISDLFDLTQFTEFFNHILT
jgi:putative ATP-dependent endonuclease of the OLD family